VYEGQDGESIEYVLDIKILDAFIHSNLYNRYMCFEDFDNLMMFGGAYMNRELYPQRRIIVDGQLKILVDVILAIDSADLKKGDKILVVGSSSDVGPTAGGSYNVASIMCPGVTVDLYDPCEITRSYDEVYNGVVTNYNHVKAEKRFQMCDYEDYDLLLDDAYVSGYVGTGRERWDPSGLYASFKNFSIKAFPDMEYNGNKYNQAFSTRVGEFRVVSRPVGSLFYKQLPILGDCAACLELKYSLRFCDRYSDDLYRFFMKMHSKCCITKK